MICLCELNGVRWCAHTEVAVKSAVLDILELLLLLLSNFLRLTSLQQRKILIRKDTAKVTVRTPKVMNKVKFTMSLEVLFMFMFISEIPKMWNEYFYRCISMQITIFLFVEEVLTFYCVFGVWTEWGGLCSRCCNVECWCRSLSRCCLSSWTGGGLGTCSCFENVTWCNL